MIIAPPIDPGIHDKNSKLVRLFSFAKFATFRSSVAAPTSIIFFSTSLVNEKLFPSFITTPLTPLSLIKELDQAPKIVVFKFCLFIYLKNSIS